MWCCNTLRGLANLALVILSDVLVTCNGRVQSSIWKNDPAFDDRISDNYILDRLNTTGRTKCISECDKTISCSSVFFMKTPALCQLHSVRFPSNSAGLQKYSKLRIGAKYFYNINENAITTTTTTTKATTTTRSTSTTSPSTSSSSTTTTPPTTTTVLQDCPGYDHLPTINMYVKILPEVYSWNTAITNCRSRLGGLMSVKNNRTWMEIAVYAEANNAVALWVNARLDDSEKDFKWQDDFTSLKNSTLWYQGQPQYPEKNTKCVMMLQMFKYRLDDTECDNTNLIHPLCYCL